MLSTRLGKFTAILLGGAALALLYGTHFRVADPPPVPGLGELPAARGVPDGAAAPALETPGTSGAEEPQRSEPMTVYKWADAQGEWHYSNVPPAEAHEIIIQRVEVKYLVTAEQSDRMAGVAPARAASPPEREAAAEEPAPPSLQGTAERLREVAKPVTDAVQPVADALQPVVDAYRKAPDLADQADDVSARMEQRNQDLQQMEEMIK